MTGFIEKTLARSWWQECLLLAVVYFLAGHVGFVVAIEPGNVSVVWPASGIALACVLLRGARIWPGIWLGSFAINLWSFSQMTSMDGLLAVTFVSVLVAFGTATGASLIAVLGARFVGAEHSVQPLDHARTTIRLLLLGRPLTCVLSATIGVTSMAAAGLIDWSAYSFTWLTWWLGDSVGVLIMTPLILAWTQPVSAVTHTISRRELLLFGTLLVVASEILFRQKFPIAYLLLALAVWSVFRFGHRGATLTLLWVAGRAIWATAHGEGPFYVQDVYSEKLNIHACLALLQTFTGMVSVSTVVLSAVLAERDVATDQLRETNRTLEDKVNSRTLDLSQAVTELQAAKTEVDDKNRKLGQNIHKLQTSQLRADRIFSAYTRALPNTVLDEKYRLEQVIGTGGYGAVFRAFDLQRQCPIAVKVFRPQPGNDSPAALERFRREGTSASRLNHPHAVTVFDSGISAEGIAYLVMELLHGKTLSDALAVQPALSQKRSVEIARDVCVVLAEAHRLGVIHRDIKPGNVFLHLTAIGDVVKVVDFGLAKLFGKVPLEEQLHLTQTGFLVGTPMYTAPERFHGQPYDGRADIFSVGVMLYQMLAGCLPFPGVHFPATPTGLALQKAELPPLPSFHSGIPTELFDIVRRALAVDPNDRPTAEKLAEELQLIADSLDETEPVIPVRIRKISVDSFLPTEHWLGMVSDCS